MMPNVTIEFTCPDCERVYKLAFTREEAKPILDEIEASDSNLRVCDTCAESDPPLTEEDAILQAMAERGEIILPTSTEPPVYHPVPLLDDGGPSASEMLLEDRV